MAVWVVSALIIVAMGFFLWALVEISRESEPHCGAKLVFRIQDRYDLEPAAKAQLASAADRQNVPVDCSALLKRGLRTKR